MNIEMIPLEIVGLKNDLQVVLHSLRNAGCVHIDELSESPEVSARPLTLDREALRHQEEMGFLLARIDGLIDTLEITRQEGQQTHAKSELDEARTGVDTLMTKVQGLTSHREKLQAEMASLPRYEATLKKLLPIIPPSARQPGSGTIGILVSRTHVGVLDSVGKRVLDLTKGQADVLASDIDASTRAMLIVFPAEYAAAIEALLGREDVSRLRLPAELGEGPPDVVLAALHRRLVSIPQELKTIEQELAGQATEWRDRLLAWSAMLRDELDANSVLSRFGETDMSFVLVGWVPAKDFKRTKEALQDAVGERVLVQKLPLTPELRKRAPVELQNPLPAQPFESLVNLLALPRYGHIDPTQLMAFFLPIFFGMILGDVGYGALILLLCLWLMRKMKKGVARDVLIVLAMGSGWSILFGFLYGEAFGTLGEHWGMHPLWFDRASPENVAGLLLMTIGVGAVHVTLGLILGVW